MMDTFKQAFLQLTSSLPAFNLLLELIRRQQLEAWLVGGVVRDLLRQRRSSDIDLATAADPTALAKQWARQVNGRWFWLDPQRLQSRVLLANDLTVDFAPLRAKTITEDQYLRDFSINSLAFPLHQDFSSAALLDPLQGQEHLRQNILQTCSKQSFIDDPLRMLKGVRHAVTLEMQLTATTLRQLQQHAALIKKVAGERIREELGRILCAGSCSSAIKLLIDTGLLAALFGPAGPAWKKSAALKALQALEQQMRLAGLQPSAQVDSTQKQELYSQRTLFLLASLLKSYAPQNLPEILHQQLRLSRQQQRLLIALQNEPSTDWFSLTTGSIDGRRQALLVEQLGYAPDKQLLYLAICPNILHYQRALELRQSFIDHQQLGRIPDLLSGELIRDLLPRPAGQQIGLWQQRIKAAEIAGEISSAEQAGNFLKEQISI